MKTRAKANRKGAAIVSCLLVCWFACLLVCLFACWFACLFAGLL